MLDMVDDGYGNLAHVPACVRAYVKVWSSRGVFVAR